MIIKQIKNKKSQKSKKDLPKAERHFGVLLESMDSKLDFVVEGHVILNNKIDKHYKEFQEFRGEVNYKLDSHSEMIGATKVDVEIIKQDIEFIKNSLRKKVDIEEFEVLEKRVAALEKSRR